MLVLHYHPGNASFAPHVLLNEIGAPYLKQRVDRDAGEHKSAEYLKLNPNGLIPVLVDGDLVLYESAAICLHLCDSWNTAALAPPLGTAERAQFYKWLVWMTNTMQATLMHYFYPERIVDAGNAEAAAQVRAHAQAKVDGCLCQLDTQLAAHGQDWFLGETYTAVDAYALMLCRWTRGFKVSEPARRYTHIGPYLQRMLARRAVQRTFEKEGITAQFV